VKPGDFLLGVLDVFAILLPGSLATWLVLQYLPTGVLRNALSVQLGATTAEPNSVALAIAFLLSSYMLGHFIFMAGAQLDPIYNRWRERTKPKHRDRLFKAAGELRAKLTRQIVDSEFTTLKWAKVYVQIQAPASRTEIDRLEADSKFFRSLVVVLIAFAGHFILREHAPGMGAVTLLMGVLSFFRYCEQRWKMTELSYGTALIVGAVKSSSEGCKNLGFFAVSCG